MICTFSQGPHSLRRYSGSSPTIQIEQMSRKEKVQTMEAIWEDLSKADADIETPAWHEAALKETEARVAAGQERIALATLAAGVWINVSEFLRNEILFKGHWLAKYETLELEFPSAPVNGAFWGLWGFIFAGCIVAVRRQSTLAGTIALCWTLGFALMWIASEN